MSFGNKFLSFFGFEEGEREDEDMYYDGEDNLQEDMMDFEEEEDQERDERRFGRKVQRTQQKVVGLSDNNKVRVLIYKPTSSNEDPMVIVDNLKEQKSLVVNLSELESDVAQRILDFVSGAVYALNGSIRKAAPHIFVVAPYNVDVSTNIEQDQDDYRQGYLDR